MPERLETEFHVQHYRLITWWHVQCSDSLQWSQSTQCTYTWLSQCVKGESTPRWHDCGWPTLPCHIHVVRLWLRLMHSLSHLWRAGTCNNETQICVKSIYRSPNTTDLLNINSAQPFLWKEWYGGIHLCVITRYRTTDGLIVFMCQQISCCAKDWRMFKFWTFNVFSYLCGKPVLISKLQKWLVTWKMETHSVGWLLSETIRKEYHLKYVMEWYWTDLYYLYVSSLIKRQTFFGLEIK